MAILKRRYLKLILSGEKRIECRLTRIPCAPFGRIAAGERILLKESSGPVCGEAVAGKVRFRQDLSGEEIDGIEGKYNRLIKAEADFWRSRRDCRYCSLIWLKDVRWIEPYRIERKGRQAWIVHEAND